MPKLKCISIIPLDPNFIVVETFKLAQIEPRSWGNHPLSYTIRSSGSRDISFEVDIISPWDSTDKAYHLFLVSDDSCLTKLPFYIPRRQRVALLKESHLFATYERACVPKLLNKFELVITHHDDQASADSRIKLVPYSSNMVDLCPYNSIPCLPAISQKFKLCSAVISLGPDAFSSPALFLRKEVIEYLSAHDSADLFGRSTNPIERKSDALVPYAFSIAMENVVSPIYFTEKLIDCILTGTIPIYHGSRSVLNYFDERGILFFDSLEELKEILSNLCVEDYIALRRYAEKNFDTAVRLKLADYHGYLHRACDVIASSVQLKYLRPFRISTTFLSRLRANVRYRLSSLGVSM